jgi:hypothetical protein
MKYLILLLALSGCSTMGHVFKGMGNGLQQASKNRPLECTEKYRVGDTIHADCR